jgi:thiosulfate dehydrogenase (quinone) large subunit
VAILAKQFHGTPLPEPLVLAFAYALPWIETVIGVFMLIGLFTRAALSAGSLLIMILTFGTTLRQDWETVGLQLMYAVVHAA